MVQCMINSPHKSSTHRGLTLAGLCCVLILGACAEAGKPKDRWEKLYGSNNSDYDKQYRLPKGYQGCLDDAPSMSGC